MGQRAISTMVGRPETREALYRTIQDIDKGGNNSPVWTTEELKELEWRGINTYWDKKNKYNYEIHQQISQRNNREDFKENSRVEEIASAIRNSYRANGEKLEGSDLEDLFNQNDYIKNEKLNKITRKILSGVAAIQSPFFGDKTTATPESRRIIEAAIIGRGVRQTNSGDVRSSRTKKSEQTTKQELALVKFAIWNGIWWIEKQIKVHNTVKYRYRRKNRPTYNK